MKNVFKNLIIAMVLPVFLLACGNDARQAAVSGSIKPMTADAAKPVEEAPKQDAAAQQSEPPLKNPFQSYIIAKRLDSESEAIVKGPLECCELSTFMVVAALVVTGDKPYALVNGPENKRYIVHLGDQMGVNAGKIVHIDSTGIKVREIIKDVDGNIVTTNDVELKISEKQDGGSQTGGAQGRASSGAGQRPAPPQPR